jgi:hypothetical protein
MTLSILSHGGVVALGYDSSTNERGYLNKIVNRTGGNSVKGSLVSASTTADLEAILQANEYDSFGVVAESGVAEGAEMWIWCNGSICQVLFEDGVTPTHGNILICSDVDGRGDSISNPGSGLPAVDIHFKEAGHVLESKASGTDVLALCMLHFN